MSGAGGTAESSGAGGTAGALIATTDAPLALAGKNTPSSSSEWAPTLENVRGQNVRGTWLPLMTIRALATTRRGRISDWALGAFIAALPGSAQTLNDMFATQKIPAVGHLTEILIAAMSVGFLVKSAVDFSQPTSLDVLEEACPGATRGLSWFGAIGKAMRRWKADFRGE